MKQLVTTVAATALDPDDYDRRYNELENRHQQLENEYQRISERINDLRRRRAQAIEARDFLSSQPPLEYSG